jgi:ankyrin repeat protein
MKVRIKIITGSLYIIIFLLCSIPLYSQRVTVIADTSDYLPYPDGLDYNLMIAAAKGYTEEIDRLIRLGANVETKTNQSVTALMYAVVNNQTDCVKALLAKGADPNIVTSYFESPLLAAVKNANFEITETLIRNHADVNYSDASGASALHYAAINGSLSIADMLLYYNSSVDNQTNDGTTPLMTAIWVGYPDVEDLLIQNGADLNKKDNNGFSPFLIAAQNGDTISLNLLNKAGADIYATNRFNYNALCLAIKENHSQTVTYLLHAGNLWGLSLNNALDPQSVAIKYGRRDIIKILEKDLTKKKPTLSFDQAAISLSARLTSHDYFTGVTIRFKEPLLNVGVIIGYDFKPIDSKLILRTGESVYYQYFDKRSVFYGGIIKDFDLTDRSLKSYLSLTASISGAYTFGNHFKGTNLSPDKRIDIVPSLYLKWQNSNIEFFSGLDFMKTEFYKDGPLWFRFGCTYNVFFDNVRSPGKKISWY